MSRQNQFAATARRIRAIPDKGTYILYLELKSEKRIAVGKLGPTRLAPGCYAYVGRAFGPGGLAARLAHHLRRAASPHWHIDYLRLHVGVSEVWYGRTGPFAEHRWARALSLIRGAEIPIPGFGSSDCGCPSHLLRFVRTPCKSTFRRRLQRLSKAAPATIHRMTF